MNYRWYERLAALDISTAGTYPLDIKGSDPITALMIQVRVTNNTGTVLGPSDLAIKRIKIMDGSTVIFSGKGISLVPYHFYNIGKEPHLANTFTENSSNVMTAFIPFGRHLFDQEYGLDTSRFKNLSIEIEHNAQLAGVPTIATATLEIYALMFDEKTPTFKGYLNMKEIYAYVLTDSSVRYVPIPVDHTLRSLMVQSRATGKNMTSQFNQLKLREDADKHVIFDESTAVLAKLLYPQPAFREYLSGKTGAGSQRLHYGYSCYEAHTVANIVESDNGAYTKAAFGPNRDVYCSAALAFDAFTQGYCPNGMFFIPFGDPKVPEDWFKLRTDQDLELIVTAGSSVLASSTLEVLVQQEILY